MTLLNPDERRRSGAETQSLVLGKTADEARTLFDSSWGDYLFAEIWTRPGLDLRSRYLISIPGASRADTPADILDGYVRGAISQDVLSVTELREAALHFAVYGGWSRGAIMDAAISRVVAELGMSEKPFEPICNVPWDPQLRLEKGAEEFYHVMTFGGPPPATAYFEGGILNFVFGEMWHRSGLDQRGRRWVTLVGVADSSADVPINTHIYGAMASGNASYQEMDEFVLQYAIHSGWPRASFVQGVVLDMAKKLKQGLTWDGKPLEKADEETDSNE